MKTVDLSAVLDDGEWGGYQKALVGGRGAGHRVRRPRQPGALRRTSGDDARVERAALGADAGADHGFVGMMFGGFFGGVVGDKLGRRVALLGSLISFGVLTLMVPLADGPVRALGAPVPGGPRSRRGDAQRGDALVRVRAGRGTGRSP